jgi:hypothetical protein
LLARYIAQRLLTVLQQQHAFSPVRLSVEVEENVGQSATVDWHADARSL